MFYHSLPPMHLIFNGWLIAWEDTPWCEHDWKGCLCGCGVQESRVRAGETGKLKDGEIWRALSARRGFYFSCQSSVISENTSHTIWCSILHRSLLGCLYFPLLFFPTSSLIFPLISWPLLFRYFSLLNSSHLIFILTTTFFLSLPLCFQVSRGKKRGEEARDGASFFYTRLIFLAFILSL